VDARLVYRLTRRVLLSLGWIYVAGAGAELGESGGREGCHMLDNVFHLGVHEESRQWEHERVDTVGRREAA